MYCPSCKKPINDHAEKCPHCGYVLSEIGELSYFVPEGTILNNRYKVGKVLGSGGFGITYKGYDTLLSRIVAIKEYYPNGLAVRGTNGVTVRTFSGDYGSQYHTGLDKFISEARRLAEFGQEKGIVQIYDCINTNNTGYIIMEYLEGSTIRDYVKAGKRYTFNEAGRILVPALDALQVVHSHGIIHRDIAPDNIFITKQNKVLLIDFGAAHYAATDFDKTISIILKHGYAPEEQYQAHGKIGPWTDIYGISATMYYMVTGRKPVNSVDRIAQDRLILPSSLNTTITPAQEAVILKGMAVHPENRFQSAAQMKKAVMGGGQITQRTNSVTHGREDRPVVAEEKNRRNTSSGKWRVFSLISCSLCMIIIAICAFILYGDKQGRAKEVASLGYRALDKQEYKKAESHFKDSLDISKESPLPEAQLGLAEAYQKQDMTDEAEEVLLEAGDNPSLSSSTGMVEDYNRITALVDEPATTEAPAAQEQNAEDKSGGNVVSAGASESYAADTLTESNNSYVDNGTSQPYVNSGTSGTNQPYVNNGTSGTNQPYVNYGSSGTNNSYVDNGSSGTDISYANSESNANDTSSEPVQYTSSFVGTGKTPVVEESIPASETVNYAVPETDYTITNEDAGYTQDTSVYTDDNLEIIDESQEDINNDEPESTSFMGMEDDSEWDVIYYPEGEPESADTYTENYPDADDSSDSEDDFEWEEDYYAEEETGTEEYQEPGSEQEQFPADDVPQQSETEQQYDDPAYDTYSTDGEVETTVSMEDDAELLNRYAAENLTIDYAPPAIAGGSAYGTLCNKLLDIQSKQVLCSVEIRGNSLAFVTYAVQNGQVVQTGQAQCMGGFSSTNGQYNAAQVCFCNDTGIGIASAHVGYENAGMPALYCTMDFYRIDSDGNIQPSISSSWMSGNSVDSFVGQLNSSGLYGSWAESMDADYWNLGADADPEQVYNVNNPLTGGISFAEPGTSDLAVVALSGMQDSLSLSV